MYSLQIVTWTLNKLLPKRQYNFYQLLLTGRPGLVLLGLLWGAMAGAMEKNIDLEVTQLNENPTSIFISGGEKPDNLINSLISRTKYKNAFSGNDYPVDGILNKNYNSFCATKVQLTHFTPNICYYNSSEIECRDQCLNTLPTGSPNCYMDLSLPCDLRDELFDSSPSIQTQGEDTWIHISDLLNFPALRSDLHIIRRELFQELYKDYVKPPVSEGFSASTQQIKKDNFRLLSIDNAKQIITPLKAAAIFKRVTLGQSLERSVELEYGKLQRRIDSFPFYSEVEKAILQLELNTIKEQELELWDFIKSADRSLVHESRIIYLNNKLRNLADKINALDSSIAIYMVDKSVGLLPANLKQCESGICVNKIPIDEVNYYQTLDKKHTHLEVLIDNLMGEAESLDRVVGSDLEVVNATEYNQPDFTNLINSKLTAYQINPSENNLKELEVAINVAFLQLGIDGKELFTTLKSQSLAQLSGIGFLEPFEDRKILLCRTLSDLDQRLKNIQVESIRIANEAGDIIKLMLEQGHSLELRIQLEQLVSQLSALATESQRISQVNRFSLDRKNTIIWNLDDGTSFWDSDLYQVQVEFISYNGNYWTPTDTVPLMDMIPAIADISTIKGSLLPNANGSIAALQLIRLTLRQSAYTACSPGNEEVRLVVKLTDPKGDTKRYTLTAIVDQI
ncbi:hypothetical protein [uncultured Microbulbifer sp.]|uniref:hypothetical protein n=1 Tax=uncultured Microbulbifer sp. TaxID=348147 RepID=UPI00260D2FC8|nr:hypothetical protein [uncultured Microbulbifer sp.]